MMKHVTFEAPRSTAATTGGRTSAAFRPSRASFFSSGRGASFSIGLLSRPGSNTGGREPPGRGRLARPHGHHVGIAQVDPLEAEVENARAGVEVLELHQRL